MLQSTDDKILGIISPLIRRGLVGWANIPNGAGSVLVERATGCRILSPEGHFIFRNQRFIFTRKLKYNFNEFKKHAIIYEGYSPYMYLDIKGLVTVGIGHQIDGVKAAAKLPFHDRKTKTQSHAIHKENAYLKVLNSGIKDGLLRAFENVTQIDLNPADIRDIFKDDINIFIRELKQNNRFPDFETYPGLVQRGILDLVFNFGVPIFFDLYGQFQKALSERNWIEVANQSTRKEFDDKGKFLDNVHKRNIAVQGWFRLAIFEEPFFINPKCRPKPLSNFPRSRNILS